MLLEALAQEYEPLTFANPLEVVEYLRHSAVDLLITDFNMPRMDGIELLKKAKEIQPGIMSIMITANGEESVRIQALDEGVDDFLTKPYSPSEVKLRIKNRHILRLEERSTQALKEREHEALRILSKTAEYKDPETASHVARVAHYSKLLGRLYGLDKEEQEILFYAAPLHDIGKVGIKDDILLKPGKLDDDEFELMKAHSRVGYEILADAENPYLRAGAVIAQSHHEKYNGRGYPLGLTGEDIPLYGRIVAIADVFDALTSIRPYKRAWSFEEAMELIKSEKGEHFDPVLVDLFVESETQIREIFIRFGAE
ncbi:MAG: response regulator [Campylobacterales bacterium]|nr:response regulator [Campylobacterales bacterium]